MPSHRLQAGFGFYLDMFLNDATNRYYRSALNGSRLARLDRNLGFARDAADEYVWVYGEQCRWWGKPLNLPHSVGNVMLNLFDGRRIDQRPLHHARLGAAADLQFENRGGELLGEDVIDLLLHEDTVRADAGLSHVAEF